MRLMSLKQYMKMSKPALIRKITKALRAMPKAKLARLCYNITKAKLPRLYTGTQTKLAKRIRKIRESKTKQLTKAQAQRLDRLMVESIKLQGRKQLTYKKRKFSPKQLAAQRLFAKRARAGTLRRR